MRVVYFVRADAGRLVGGSTEQALRYAEAVRNGGGQADVCAGDRLPSARFDVAHLLNLDWPLETAQQLALAKRCARRVVLSPIHHRRSWVEDFHRRGRHGVAGAIARSIGLDGFERLRNVHLARARPRLCGEAARQLAVGVEARQRQILREADAWFVIAEGETESLTSEFGVERRPTYLVRNGAEWSDADPELKALPEEFVLSVGRLEARKNQLLLAETLVDLDVPGVFVGAPNPRHRAYVRRFSALVAESPNLIWFPDLERGKVVQLYSRARLHVLSSWFEVVPLVDLEAAVAGCPVVTTTRGYTDEYLGSDAIYWEPETGKSGLREAVVQGLELPRRAAARTELRRTLSWQAVTEQLVERYEQVLASP